jgi:alpha-mannosidase
MNQAGSRAVAILLTMLLGTAIVLSGSVTEKRSPDVKKAKETGSRTSLPAAGGLSIISSSHQDIAWMDAPQKCVEFRDRNVITPALAMLGKNSAYAFTMENMLNLMEYQERHPERKEEMARFTREGRMEWGATFNQPYESLLSGEQLIREAYFGRRWIKKNFPGCDARVYFNPDVPGRSMQMPQILAKAGIPYMVMSRYHEGFYRWASPDGTSVLAYSPGHYGNASAYLNAAPEEAAKAIAGKVAKWEEYYAARNLPPRFPLLNSVDFSQPTDFGTLIKNWNESGRTAGTVPLTMEYSSARRFFETIDVKTAKLQTITGERPNLWLYIHGPTHHWAISAAREAGRLLPAAETFSAVRAVIEHDFGAYPARRLEEAWQAAIYPDHGWGGKEGQITDRLFRKKYEFARDEARDMLYTALAGIASHITTQSNRGVPLIVFNTLSWKRTDPIACLITPQSRDFLLLDGDGKESAYQRLPALPGQAAGAVRIEFTAGDVPALGYKTWYLAEGRPAGVTASASARGNIVENAFYRIELAPGGVKSIFDKELGREVLATGKFLGFEVFTMQSVGNGAGEFGRVQQPTMEGFDRLSLHGPDWKYNETESGPMKTVFSLEQPLKNGTVRQKLIVRNDIKRIDCEVGLLDWDGDPYREFRIALPVNAEKGRVAYEVPLGVVEVGSSEIKGTGGPAYGGLVYDEECSDIRPREVQSFLSASDDSLGVTLSTSVAVCDFKDPTTSPVAYPVLQPILLASRRSCHGEGNWYLQEGDHHYSFSMVSHRPGWRNGWRAGIQAGSPLVVIANPATEAKASLPDEMDLVSTSAGNVIVSTLKKAEDDASLILRVYDIEGRDAEARLNLFFPLRSLETVNMIEEAPKALKPAKDGFVLKVGHHAVETFRLVPGEKRK